MIALIATLRVVGILEGISFLVLLGIAMPLKYLANLPQMVAVVGGIHGGLFILYVVLALWVTLVFRWPLLRFGQAIVASLIPAGTFWFDRKLKDLQGEVLPSGGK
jgi:integral membrane protein